MSEVISLQRCITEIGTQNQKTPPSCENLEYPAPALEN